MAFVGELSEITMNDVAKENPNGLLFFREVAKYFMDFLETDFHKHKFPRRSVKFHNNDNLLVGLNLQKYETFFKVVLDFIANNFDKAVLNKIEKGVYKTTLPKTLLNLITLQVEQVPDDQINSIVAKIAVEIQKAGTLHEKEYDVALTSVVEATVNILRSDLLTPFIHSIEKPLQNLSLGDEDNIYAIEEELTAIFVNQLDDKISEVLNHFIAKDEIDIEKELAVFFAAADVRATLSTFFVNLQVADLFSELFEMERNKSILDKQELYLYFGDISFRNIKYPLFYIPVATTRQGESLALDFDSQIYINKRALEFIVQEFNATKGTKGNLKSVTERIIYLAQHKEDLQDVLEGVLTEITNFFELADRVNFRDGEHQLAKGASVRISNSCYLSLFDKSDEALVNDYEEILQQLAEGGGALAGAFHQLLEDFLHKNPEACNPVVEQEWDNTETPDRLVVPSPIPLNSEQLQILAAIKNDNCKHIVVQGPPGTGKSHTITAIIFNSILRNQSVLVLSDKKEALDVVENNITQTMNKVRYDKNFQNPILRLGKTGNTYSQILAKGTIEGIKTHFRAVKKDYETIAQNIDKSTNTLKDDLEAEVVAYEDVNVEEIQELIALEGSLEVTAFPFVLDELLRDEQSAVTLCDLRTSLDCLKNSLHSDDLSRLLQLLAVPKAHIQTLTDYETVLRFCSTTQATIDKLTEVFRDQVRLIASFLSFNQTALNELNIFVKEYDDNKAFLVGYLFKKQKIAALDLRFKQTFDSTFITPHRDVQQLRLTATIFEFIHRLGTDVNNTYSTSFDYIGLIHHVLTEPKLSETLVTLASSFELIAFVKSVVEKYPETAKLAGINLQNISSLSSNAILNSDALLFDKQLRYVTLRQKLSKDFARIPDLNYALRRKNIEDLVITRVAYLLDGRLINFYEHNRSDAETLRSIIKGKQKFPKQEFQKLKEAFPCILAGIRDYAEYIPLEQGMFDLVIIDEASQVSVAQAFPALLRAKKVLILGDKKQFSNIKAAQARSDTNREYLSSLDQSFRRNVSSETTKLVRLGKFNIKTSILEFFEFISNYYAQLIKHFRGYKELISYSNAFFYQNNLQVMKIRGKPISDVIKFSFVEPTPDDEVYPNTNAKEVEFIISELRKLLEANSKLTIGIITPHTNQQKLLVEQIHLLPESDYYFTDLSLKIMTFDTCQGEERDLVFYSMVASEHSDKLWGVFIKDLANVDIEEDGQIKAQRLNVGFSRAKECMHFVLSKPLSEFRGSVGDALRHYQHVFDEAQKERDVAEVDLKSQKEPEVLNWFYQTEFWKNNKRAIEFIPQFEIGKYLRQLDHSYSHPAYKVDFLLVYRDERQREHKIIIEYDGFQEHFAGAEGVNAHNYEHYFSSDDVFRQKVLESYGYKFIRINRFNAGDNPISTLNNRITRLVMPEPSDNPLLKNIHQTIEGLQHGDMKECPKCQQVRSLQEFKDPSLITGYGRFCAYCKGRRVVPAGGNGRQENAASPTAGLPCPKCNSRMVLRNGPRGTFFGCSRFPLCRGTRSVAA